MSGTSFQPALLIQVTENPIEILTRFTGRNIIYAALTLAATWLVVRLINAFLETLSRQAPRARFFFKLLEPVLRFFYGWPAQWSSFRFSRPRATRCWRCWLRWASHLVLARRIWSKTSSAVW